jgi:plastocyanin
MKRREFVERVGIGSAGIVAAATLGRAAAASAAEQHVHDPTQVDGPLAHATVSFGQWLTTPPIDRFATGGNTRTENQHKVIPYNATIKAGGSVSFIISGVHLLLIYAPGVTMASIDETLIEFAVPGVFPGFINDPTNRIYRGLDPRTPAPLDRVEVVTFEEPGRYLVVCGIVSHFLANMSGFVNVVR